MASKKFLSNRGIVAAVFLHAAILSSCSSGPEEKAGEPAAVGKLLVFKGNEEISEGSIRSALEKDLELSEKRGFRKSDIDDLAYEMERYYRNQGYHFARVEYEDSPEAATFQIQEGPRVLIREVQITGNTIFSKEELTDLLASRRAGLLGLQERIYVAAEVAALRGAIQEVYFERGYQDILIDEPATKFSEDRTGANISLAITEGPQYVLKEIDVQDVPLLDREELSKRFAPLLDSAYVPRLLFEVETGVEEAFAEEGNPYARALVSKSMQRDAQKSQVDVSFQVSAQAGPAVRIKEILVKGNDRTNTEYIKSRVILRNGDLYRSSLIRRSFRRLFNTGIFKSVNLRLSEPPGRPEDTGILERDLIIDVVEGSTLEYFFEVGFGSYDLARGKAGVRKKNLFGRGLIGRAELLGSIRGLQATVGLTDPWFLRTEWSADLPVTFLYREEPSYTIEELKSGLRLSRNLTRNLVGGAAYRFSLSRVEEFEIEDISQEEPSLRLGALGPFLEYDSRDDIINPTRGLRSRIFGEVGGPFFGGEIYFLHGGATISKYLKILEGTTLAGTLHTEWIVPFSKTELIPIQERLFNGGENTVRSFQQSELGPKDISGEPLGGEVRNLISLELRQRIIGQLSLAIFGEYGNVAFDSDDAFDDFRPAVGFGARYGLPIGAVRVDVGFNPDQRDDEDLYTIHFAVGLPY